MTIYDEVAHLRKENSLLRNRITIAFSKLAEYQDNTVRAEAAENNEEMYRLAIKFLKRHPKANVVMPDLYRYIEKVVRARKKVLANVDYPKFIKNIK